MAKRFKRRPKKDKVQKRRPDIIVVGALSAIFLLVIIGLFIFAYKLLYKSDYFFIKETRIDWLDEPLTKAPYKDILNAGVGQNIFAFDISSAMGKVQKVHPEFKDVRIIREYPDSLVFKIRPRRAVAQVGDETFFLVDRECVILTEPQNQIREELPIITGIGWRIIRKVGQKEDSAGLRAALILIDAMKDTKFTSVHTLAKIDASDYKNISFFIEDGLEVKIGHSNFRERLELLNNMLSAADIDKGKIKYIDLRFEKAVLGTK